MKVLIVDDEILIRVGIKSCIDWEANGFEVAGLAEDGVQAFEMIKDLQPDIVLTDIKMPNMDGLELIEKIKEQYPHIRVMVLSCYNELDFIKKAMKLGADDYILKLSMQPDDLLAALNGIKKTVSEKQRDITINRSFMKEELYKRVIDRSLHGGQLVGELKKLGTDISFASTSLICAGIDDYSNASVRSRLEDKYLLKFSVINIIEEILSNYCKGDIAEIEKGKFLIIFDLRDHKGDYRKSIREFFYSTNNALKNYLNITISFGVSDLWKNKDNFNTRYAQASRALEQRFFSGRESLLFYDGSMDLSDKPVLLNFVDEKLLVSCLENLDEDRARKVITSFFHEIQSKKEYHPSKVRKAAVEIYHSFLKVAKKFEFEEEFEVIETEDCDNPIDMLMKAETISDISGWFSSLVGKFVGCLSNKRLSAEHPEIIKLKRYMADHVYEDITLDKAAKITNMNRSYLSSLFKKETGESFTDYFNRLKMEEAKELIQRYGLRTGEVAYRLGFNNESYFSKLFKKYVGVNPSKV